MPKNFKDEILPVNKPAGISTYDLIRQYKKQNNYKGKIGHAGTLDPFACGLVLLLLGKATKRFEEIRTWKKTYLAGLKLGAISSTGDTEGEIKLIKKQKPKDLNAKKIKKVLNEFIGQIEQKVPVFSAAKHQGQPLYKLAQKGIKINKTKKITIFSIEFISFKWPVLSLRVTCSGGTYIRQLAEDIGARLHCGAFLNFLQREKIGDFTLS